MIRGIVAIAWLTLVLVCAAEGLNTDRCHEGSQGYRQVCHMAMNVLPQRADVEQINDDGYVPAVLKIFGEGK